MAVSPEVRDIAKRIAQLSRTTEALSRAAQIARSTVPVPDGADGTIEMSVPEAVGRGVQAGFDAQAVDQKLDDARAELEAAMAELDSKLGQADIDLGDAQARLDAAEQSITDAFGRIGGLDTRVDDAEAAASTAQSTADTARQEATQKAQAAEAAAKEYAEAEAEAARLAAEAAASNDAQVKADAAKQAAIAAAALDAKQKADAAQAAAEQAAQTAQQKADAAHTLAGSAEDHAQAAITSASAAADLAEKVDAKAVSRGTDLVTNGTGLLGDNTNFPNMTYDPTDAPTGAKGSFDFIGAGTRGTAEVIPVDASREYLLRLQVKQKNPALTGTLFYAGLQPVDAQGQAIDPRSYSYKPGKDATLAAPLNPGDTVVKLTSTAGWDVAGVGSYFYIGFWNWVDPAGRLWPKHTYTRNYAAYIGTSVTSTSITLAAPYAGPALPAGSPVSQSVPGGSYMYAAASGAVMPTEWTEFSGEVGGVHDGSRGVAVRAFPPGTAGVRLVWLLTYNNTGVPSGQVSRQSVASVSFSDTTAAAAAAAVAQAAAQDAQSTADNLPKVLHGINSAPSGTAPDGSIWWNHENTLRGRVLGQWNRVAGSWVETPIGSEAIANLDVGKLTAGGATIAEVVAQAIASATASFQRADIKNLFVTAGATINEAVIEKLWTDVVKARLLISEGLITSDAIVDELVGKIITAVTINGGTINGVTMVGTAFTTKPDFDPESTWGVYISEVEGVRINGDHPTVYAVGTTEPMPPGGWPVPTTTRMLDGSFEVDGKYSLGDVGQLHGTAKVDSAAAEFILDVGTPVQATAFTRVEAGRVLFEYMHPTAEAARKLWLGHGVEMRNADLKVSSDQGVVIQAVDDLALTGDAVSVDSATRLDLNAGNGVYVNGQPLGQTTDWEPIPLASGMTPLAGTGNTPQVRLKGGMVLIRGTVAGNIANGAQLGTLPSKYCPPNYIRAASPTSAGVSQRINIDTSGNILGNFGGGTVTWQSLDGIVPYSVD